MAAEERKYIEVSEGSRDVAAPPPDTPPPTKGARSVANKRPRVELTHPAKEQWRSFGDAFDLEVAGHKSAKQQVAALEHRVQSLEEQLQTANNAATHAHVLRNEAQRKVAEQAKEIEALQRQLREAWTKSSNR